MLSKPHPDSRRYLWIIPLGGLGDIGRNMTAFEINTKILLVDCGVLFPEDNQPGVDLILPGLDYLDDRLDDVVALVLTHGHEDHIGAVPYLLRRRQDIALFGSKLRWRSLTANCANTGCGTPPYHEVAEGDRATSTSSPGVLRGQPPSQMRSPWRSRSPPAPCCTPVTSRWTSL